MSHSWAELASRARYTIDDCRRAAKSLSNIRDEELQRLIDEHQSPEACVTAAFEGALLIPLDRWSLGTANVFLDEKKVSLHAGSIAAGGLYIDTWLRHSSSCPMPVVLIMVKDALDIIQPLGFYIAAPPYDSLSVMLARIQAIVRVAIPRIRINVDQDLLQACLPTDISVEVSIYTVIRDICFSTAGEIEMGIIIRVVESTVGSATGEWQQAIRASHIASVQPTATERIISVLEQGACSGNWGSRWLGGVRLSSEQIKNFAYQDRITIELRKGICATALAPFLRAAWLNQRDVALPRVERAYDMWRDRAAKSDCLCDLGTGWCEHIVLRYLTRMGSGAFRPMKIPGSIRSEGSAFEISTLDKLYHRDYRIEFMREKNGDEDMEMLSNSFRTTSITSPAPTSRTNVSGQGYEGHDPLEDHHTGGTLSRSADTPPSLIDQIPHLIEILKAAPTRCETLLPESGLSRMNAIRYLLWGMTPFIDCLAKDLAEIGCITHATESLIKTTIEILGEGSRNETTLVDLMHQDHSPVSLSSVLVDMGLGSDRYRALFSTAIEVEYLCQRCIYSRPDELDSVMHFEHPFDDFFDAIVSETPCERDGCAGHVTVQRLINQGLPQIVVISGNLGHQEVREYVARGIISGDLDQLGTHQVSAVYYEDDANDQAITARLTGQVGQIQQGWIYSHNAYANGDLVVCDNFRPRAVYFTRSTVPDIPHQGRDRLASSLHYMAWLHDKSRAFMTPFLLDKLANAWRYKLQLDILGNLSDVATLWKLDLERFTPRRRCTFPSRPEDDRRRPIETLADCKWTDTVARPSSDFVTVASKDTVALSWEQDEMGRRLRGDLWSCEMVAYVVQILAKKDHIGNETLVSHIPIINHTSRLDRKGKVAKIDQGDIDNHTAARIREYESLPDIYTYSRLVTFGLMDNHFFAIVIDLDLATIHLIDSLETSPTALGKIEKLAAGFLNGLLSSGIRKKKWSMGQSSSSVLQGPTLLCGLFTVCAIDAVTDSVSLPLDYRSMGFSSRVAIPEEIIRIQQDIAGLVYVEWQLLASIIDQVMIRSRVRDYILQEL